MSVILDKKYMGCFLGLKLRKTPPWRIIIHHSCTASAEKTRHALKFKGCSTCFEVEKDGHIYQYADPMEICQHCTGQNARAIGIDVTHMKDAPFPQAQIDATRELVAELCAQFDIPHDVITDKTRGIFTHSAIADTLCPNGFPMDVFVEKDMDTIEAIRVLVRKAIADGRRRDVWDMIKDELWMEN